MKINAPLHSFVDMCVLCVCEAFLFFFAFVWWPLAPNHLSRQQHLLCDI